MKIFVKDLKTGDYITDQAFSLNEVQKHKTRAGNPYYNVRLVDTTGSVQAKIWENAFAETNVESLRLGDVVAVDGKIQEFNGNTQLIIDRMSKTESYNIADIQKISDKDINSMFADLEKKVSGFTNTHLKQLITTLFKDEDLVNRLKRAPAAEKVHHDYVGGLLDHIHEMLDLSEAMMKHYPEADKDMVIAGTIVHDIGKLWELESAGTTFNRSLEGYLISHIPMGSAFVKENLPQDFPEELWMKLNHIILSHHTELENGAVVKPQTIEAIIVAMADKASSTVRQYQKALEESEGSEDDFTEYQKWIGVKVYKG